jgi:hypothetical protein
MVVGARRAANELLQERMLHVAELEQTDVGLHVEDALDEGQEACHEHAG